MRITRFGGVIPAVNAKQLNAVYAQHAYNTKLWDGALRAFRESTPSVECPAACEVGVGLGETEYNVQVRNGALVYADGSPVVLDRPQAAPTVRVVNEGKDAISFRYSVVDSYGAESAKSPPTVAVRASPGSRIIVTAASYPMRLYAYVSDSLTGAQTADDFLLPFANEVLVGEFTGPASFTYDLDKWDISNDGFNTDDWCMPTGLQCIVKDSEGHYYAYSDHTVWVSERHLPHAWPRRQAVHVEHSIRQVIPYYDVAFIVTSETPVLLRKPMITNGVDEGAVDVTLNYYTQSHPATGPAVRTDFGIIYPSVMGLIALTPTVPNGLQLFTRNVINEDDWKLWSPTALAWCQGVVYGSNADRAFLLDVKDNNEGSYELGQMVEIAPFTSACCRAGYPTIDARTWNAGLRWLPAVWTSRIDVQTGVTKLTGAKVVGKALAGVVFELHERRLGLVHRKVLTDADSNRPFRLPMERGQDYWVRLELPASSREIAIEEVHVAPNFWELLRND